MERAAKPKYHDARDALRLWEVFDASVERFGIAIVLLVPNPTTFLQVVLRALLAIKSFGPHSLSQT